MQNRTIRWCTLGCASFLALFVTNIALAGARDIDKRDRNGRTALIRTAAWTQQHFYTGEETRSVAEAERLLKAGAEVNAKDRTGRTALMWAAGWDHPDILDVLLQYGADIHLRDPKGRTALTWAARAGRKQVIERLLERGAKVGVIEALLMKDAAQAERLLRNGADASG